MLHLSKNADTRYNYVNLAYNIYTVLIVIKASLEIVMLDKLKAEIFYEIRKQFQY